MTIGDKIELMRSAVKVADFFGVKVNDLLAFTAFMNEEKMKEWNALAQDVIDYQKLPFEEKAKAFGFNVVKE